ncbi:hypothetical protein [Bacillus sp. GB_SG_008]|uniref:hypothetical protein n=1 Tax=Bacillus sp. GB_SG_008 TaxID=3454627 RepID=UPI003F842F45
MQLDKIIQGLEKEVEKVEPTHMDDEAIRKYISVHNQPIVIAIPHSIMRFRKSKNKEEETSAE